MPKNKVYKSFADVPFKTGRTMIPVIDVSSGRQTQVDIYKEGYLTAFLSYLNGGTKREDVKKYIERNMIDKALNRLRSNGEASYLFYDAWHTSGPDATGGASEFVDLALDNCCLVLLWTLDRNGQQCDPRVSGWVTNELLRIQLRAKKIDYL
jgi:hypothetical protein